MGSDMDDIKTALIVSAAMGDDRKEATVARPNDDELSLAEIFLLMAIILAIAGALIILEQQGFSICWWLYVDL